MNERVVAPRLALLILATGLAAPHFKWSVKTADRKNAQVQCVFE